MMFLPENFSIKKMFKKAAKVGVASATTVSTIGMGTVGVHPTDATMNGLWAGIGTAIFTCVINYIGQVLKKEG